MPSLILTFHMQSSLKLSGQAQKKYNRFNYVTSDELCLRCLHKSVTTYETGAQGHYLSDFRKLAKNS